MRSTTVGTLKCREPAVSGLFYPDDPAVLEHNIVSMLDKVKPIEHPECIRAVIVPHAGYVYSGYVAAEAFRQLKNRDYDTVVILSPSHRDYFTGVSVYTGNYRTPLGVVEVDIDLAEEIVSGGNLVKAMDLGHREEHGVEVELPFLQVLLGRFRFVPLVMGTQDHQTSFGLGKILSEVAKNRKILFVASSDLSHFYNVSAANKLDRRLIEDVELFDEQRLYEDISTRKCEACGYGPIIATMMGARGSGCNNAKVLSYHTSGDVSGDYQEVVGYLSAILFSNES